MTNNSVSLLQSLLLKQPAVRSFFNIPVVPPKPQPGEAGYVAEPSFSDAFKNMQIGMQEKWEETQATAEAERVRKEQWEGKGTKKAEVYIPKAASAAPTGVYAARAPRRKVGEVEKFAQGLKATNSLLEETTSSARTSEIQAHPVGEGAWESVRARRIQAAREKRLAEKK